MKLSYFIKNIDAWQPLIAARDIKREPFMAHLETIRAQFGRMAEKPENQIDLVEGALLIARTAFPDLIASHCTDQLDRWAEGLQERCGPSSSAGDILSGLNRILFEKEGFRGDIHTYYDPQNSFLNRVLERKLGIPITLSLVYSEVGRRAGFPLHGIALPGHFITGLFHASGTLYIDPFNQGEILSEKECREMIEGRFGRETADHAAWKAPAGKKAILKRMLRNLKAIYRQIGQDMQVFEMIHWILVLDPDAPAELRERALLYETMGHNAFAVRDFEHYLEVEPSSEDRDVIALKISQLKSSGRWLH